MEIEKNVYLNTLFDFYQELLTSKQRKYLELYYSEDLSLGEIALEFNVSRQAVFNNIKKTTILLENYEKKLKLYQEYIKMNMNIENINYYIKNSYPKDIKLKKMIENLLNLEQE